MSPAAEALARLTAPADGEPMLDRLERLAADCADVGEFGLLSHGDYVAGGRVMVPSAVVNDLIAAARAFLNRTEKRL